MQLCGIGLIGAWVLASEIFGWRHFRNRREVGAVLGLTPTPDSSGRCEREPGISKAGNRRARAMLGGTGLAVAALPTGLGAGAVVSGPVRRRGPTNATHRHRRPGATAGDRVVAVHRPGDRAGRRQAQALSASLTRAPRSDQPTPRRCEAGFVHPKTDRVQLQTSRARINEFDSDRARSPTGRSLRRFCRRGAVVDRLQHPWERMRDSGADSSPARIEGEGARR